MNILFCDVQKVKFQGTSSAHKQGVVGGLLKMGHNVVFLNADHPGSEIEINASPRLSRWGRVKYRLLGWTILRPIGGEITILWLFLRAVYVFLLAFIIIVRRKGRFDVIYRRHSLFNSEYLLAKMFNIPLVKEVNGIIVDETRVSRWGNRISLRVMDRIERFSMPKADKIIVVTSRLKEILPKEYGVPSDKIVVIKNGANTDLFKPTDVTEARRELNLSRSDHYVCFVGRLWQMQRVGHLIKSAPLILEELPDTKFLIVGDGVMKQELISFADEVGVSDTMIFTGIVPHQEVPIYINASDVCVILEDKNFRSERLGASPLKLYEYMACGKPVVVSNVEGASEDVADAGFVFDITNVNEMARAVVTLLKNEQLRKEMGKRGREIAVEKYSWRIIAEQVAKVCQSAIKAKENA